jgi:hydrogenase-4 component B
MTVLIALALVVPTQRPTFPEVDPDEAPPTPSTVSPDAVPSAPAALLDVTDPEPTARPTIEPTTGPTTGPTEQPDALDPTAEPDAPALDAPSRPLESKESDVATAEPPALEPEPAERECDPDEPYVFRHAASDREVVLARCVSVDGTPQRLDAPPLSNALVLLIQTRLDALGFEPGPADGLIGPRTRDAIRRFQTDRGIAPTGAITFDLLDRLREPD